MTRKAIVFGVFAGSLALAAARPAAAQLGGFGKALDKAAKAKQQLDDLTFSDQEEQQLGSDISASDTVISLHGVDEPKKTIGLSDVLVSLVPANIFSALANGETLKTLVFALLFGLSWLMQWAAHGP